MPHTRSATMNSTTHCVCLSTPPYTFNDELHHLHLAAPGPLQGSSLPLAAWKRLAAAHYSDSHADAAEFFYSLAHGYQVLPVGTSIPFSSRPNHPSTRDALGRATITKQIETLLNNNVICLWDVTNANALSKISPLGLVPKKEDCVPTGDYRVIFDLSSPHSTSLNDYITAPKFGYASIDQAMRYLQRGDFMCKLDLKDGFFHCPVHQDSQRFLGFRWDKQTYAYRFLPFGLASSPYQFCRLTSHAAQLATSRLRALLWGSRVPLILVYVDDFLICAPTCADCTLALSILREVLLELGLNEKLSKHVPPTERIIFLGIQLDSQRLSASLSSQRVRNVQQALNDFTGRKKASKRELQSLAGTLNFAAKVVRGGRLWLRGIINLTKGLKRSNHHVSLNKHFYEDIEAWKHLLNHFNGISMERTFFTKTVHIFTDACGKGGGAYMEKPHLLWYHEWDALESPMHINAKELAAVVLAIKHWGPLLRNTRIHLHTDNAASVGALNNTATRADSFLPYLRELLELSLHYNFELIAEHIPGELNDIADAISRFHEPGQLMRLLSLFPNHAPSLRVDGLLGWGERLRSKP